MKNTKSLDKIENLLSKSCKKREGSHSKIVKSFSPMLRFSMRVDNIRVRYLYALNNLIDAEKLLFSLKEILISE